MNENKIEIRNLSKAFGKKVVLDGIDLDVKRGESLVVIGGSGTGKSVLIKCIQGLLNADSGSIKVDEEELSELRANRLKPCIPKWECCFRAVLCLTV